MPRWIVRWRYWSSDFCSFLSLFECLLPGWRPALTNTRMTMLYSYIHWLFAPSSCAQPHPFDNRRVVLQWVRTFNLMFSGWCVTSFPAAAMGVGICRCDSCEQQSSPQSCGSINHISMNGSARTTVPEIVSINLWPFSSFSRRLDNSTVSSPSIVPSNTWKLRAHGRIFCIPSCTSFNIIHWEAWGHVSKLTVSARMHKCSASRSSRMRTPPRLISATSQANTLLCDVTIVYASRSNT